MAKYWMKIFDKSSNCSETTQIFQANPPTRPQKREYTSTKIGDEAQIFQVDLMK
jgi:hypothetical protein